MIEPQQVLLFGGSGYIGTHLLLELHGKTIEDGKILQVVILDINPPHKQAIEYAEKKAKGLEVLFFKVDLENKDFKDGWPTFDKTPYCGIMLAAKKDVTEAEREKCSYIRTNILICVNCMEYLSKIGVAKLIQASSSTVYHKDPYTKVPVGTYGYSKEVCEDICEKLLRHDQQLVILRYMNPIGTHPKVKAFPHIGLCNVLSKITPDKIFSNWGNCSRDYIHITDLASYHTSVLREWDDLLGCHQLIKFDVGTRIPTTTAQIYDMFCKITGKSAKAQVYLSKNHFEASNVFAMTINPRTWKPRISLEKALEDYKDL